MLCSVFGLLAALEPVKIGFNKTGYIGGEIGNPAIILLDESSAGVDPYSRRRLWRTIREESS